MFFILFLIYLAFLFETQSSSVLQKLVKGKDHPITGHQGLRGEEKL
jgi:hypothetical protein